MDWFSAKKLISGIGIYQIVCGAFGVWFTFLMLAQTKDPDLLDDVILTFGLALFMLLLLGGILLYRERVAGIYISAFMQILQTIGVKFSYAFQFNSGLFFGVGYRPQTNFLFTEFSPYFYAFVTGKTIDELFYLNFVPCALLVVLLFHRKRLIETW